MAFSHCRGVMYPTAFSTIIVFLVCFFSFPSTLAFSTLKGTVLKACVLLENPYVVVDLTRRKGYEGLAITYLERLEDNLQFETTFSPWARSFSDFINEMSTCTPATQTTPSTCPCDLGVGSFTMTHERYEKINFVSPFSNEAHHMVSRKSDLRLDDSQNTWFVFRTFPLDVWAIIVCGVFLHAIGTIFYGPFLPSENNRPDNRTSGRSSSGLQKASFATNCSHVLWQVKHFPAAVLYAYAHLIGQPFSESSQGTPSFHRTAWLMLGVTTGLFLLTVYEASLTVLLFESTKTSPFRTLGDITDCNLNPGRVAMIQGGASQDFWNTAVNTSFLRQKCRWENAGLTVENLEDGFSHVLRGKADYFYSLEGSVLFRSNRNCKDFQPVGEPFFSTSVAFVMAKNGNKTLLDILSAETRKLREEDAYPSASLVAARNSCDEVVDATITLGKLKAFFIMYLITWMGLLGYRFVFLWRKRHSQKDMAQVGHNNRGMVDISSIPTQDLTAMAPAERPYESYTLDLRDFPQW